MNCITCISYTSPYFCVFLYPLNLHLNSIVVKYPRSNIFVSGEIGICHHSAIITFITFITSKTSILWFFICYFLFTYPSSSSYCSQMYIVDRAGRQYQKIRVRVKRYKVSAAMGMITRRVNCNGSCGTCFIVVCIFHNLMHSVAVIDMT